MAHAGLQATAIVSQAMAQGPDRPEPPKLVLIQSSPIRCSTAQPDGGANKHSRIRSESITDRAKGTSAIHASHQRSKGGLAT